MNAHSRPTAPNETTALALSSTVLTPNFYTTDLEKLDKYDVSSVREEWDIPTPSNDGPHLWGMIREPRR